MPSDSSSLIQRVLALPDFQDAKARPATVDVGLFAEYDVCLPRGHFPGVPDEWLFAVASGGRVPGTDTALFIQGARAIIGAAKKPVFLVSEDSQLHLFDEFRFDGAVFVLDATDLASIRARPSSVLLSPFVAALRRKLETGNLSPFVGPYQPRNPVTGHRFFGRTAELDTLLRSEESLAVLGGRRVGKSSLLRETERRLRQSGEEAYYVDVQGLATRQQITDAILAAVNVKYLYQAVRHEEVFHEPRLNTVLRKMAGAGKRVTLLLDELGTAIKLMREDDWRLFGLLRKHAQAGRLRVVFSCLQEFPRQQHADYTGPTVNFASVLRLGAFTRAEAHDFLLGPLDIWKPIGQSDRDALVREVLATVGFHPYLLQGFCSAFFGRIAREAPRRVLPIARALLRDELASTFEGQIEEVFYQFPDAVVKYLFLRRCCESYQTVPNPDTVHLDDSWVDAVLREAGLRSTSDGRRELLRGLELPGLTQPLRHAHERQVIAAPLVYWFLRALDPAEPLDLLERLRRDMLQQAPSWDLQLDPELSRPAQ